MVLKKLKNISDYKKMLTNTVLLFLMQKKMLIIHLSHDIDDLLAKNLQKNYIKIINIFIRWTKEIYINT